MRALDVFFAERTRFGEHLLDPIFARDDLFCDCFLAVRLGGTAVVFRARIVVRCVSGLPPGRWELAPDDGMRTLGAVVSVTCSLVGTEASPYLFPRRPQRRH